jgi:O-antigen/teichoic acid export membrane protein
LASIVLTLLAALLLFVATERRCGIPELVLITYVLPAMAPLCVIPWLPGNLRPSVLAGAWQWSRVRRMLRDGGIFFLLQLGVLAGWGGDALLASSQLGMAAAGIYAVSQRMFQLVNYPLAIMNAPLWPAYADAHARDDGAFIRHALKRSMLLTGFVAALVSITVASFPGPITRFWLHSNIDLPSAFLYALATWTVMDAVGNSFAMFMNGINLMRPQLFTNIAFIALALILKWVSLPRLGLLGLPVSTLVAYFATIVIPYAFFIKPHKEWFPKR